MFGAMLENLWGSRRFLIFYMVCGLGASITHQAYTGFKLMPAFSYETSENTSDFLTLIERNEGLLELASKDPQYSDYDPVALKELAAQADKEPGNRYHLDGMKARAEMIRRSVEDIPTVGASGAIYGLLMAFGMLFPNMLIHFMLFIPMRAKHFVILMIAVGVFYGVADFPGDQVAHFAHLGGMAFGFLMIKLWGRKHSF
ncbi:MAG: rhomboid family intramembrane serine protease [Bacteroidia bacterium]|nr:rhomboid family intramembrane serine protease [Bacteroidia bacterium]